MDIKNKTKVLCCNKIYKHYNITISELVKTKSKYLIGYLDKFIRPLVLIMPINNGYVKTFKDGDKINVDAFPHR